LGNGVQELPGAGVRLLAAVAAELDHQPAATLGQHAQVLAVQALPAHVVEQDVVQALQRDRLVLEDLRQLVGRPVDARVAQQDQHFGLGSGQQAAGHLQEQRAGRLGADQRGPR
jgi:hypothetical protein